MAFSIGFGKSHLNSKTKENAILKKSGLNEDMFFWLHPHFSRSMPTVHLRLYEKAEKGFRLATVMVDGEMNELYYISRMKCNGKRRTSVAINGEIDGFIDDDTGKPRPTGYVMGDKHDGDVSHRRLRNATYLWKTPQWIALQSHPQYWFDSFSVIRQIWDFGPETLDISAEDLYECIERVDNGESSESENEQEEESKKPPSKLEAARKRLAMKRKAPATLTEEEMRKQTEALHKDAELI